MYIFLSYNFANTLISLAILIITLLPADLKGHCPLVCLPLEVEKLMQILFMVALGRSLGSGVVLVEEAQDRQRSRSHQPDVI